MQKIVMIIFLISLTALAQDGFISSYHPFPNAKKILVKTCAKMPEGFVCPHGRVLVRRNAKDQLQVNLNLFYRIYPIAFETMPNYVAHVWQADLNADRKADTIIKLSWGGNGIIADANVTVFALSSQNGYQISALNSISFDPNALIYLQGKPTILHTALVGITFPKTKKFAERNHNYWVFHPLEIRGSSLLKNQAAVWVQFTYTPSHAPARLTAAQKASGLKSEPIQIFEPIK